MRLNLSSILSILSDDSDDELEHPRGEIRGVEARIEASSTPSVLPQRSSNSKSDLP